MSNQPSTARTGVMWYIKVFSMVIWAIFSALVVAVGAVYGLTFWVNTLVDSRVQSDEIIKKIANRIRPYVIFDEKDTILADMGAMNYLHSIHVEVVLENPDAIPSYKITVTPNQFLSNVPILQVLEGHFYEVKTGRGPGYEFVYTIDVTGISAGDNVERTHARFRLEILI
jgi:hypothetical protein